MEPFRILKHVPRRDSLVHSAAVGLALVYSGGRKQTLHRICRGVVLAMAFPGLLHNTRDPPQEFALRPAAAHAGPLERRVGVVRVRIGERAVFTRAGTHAAARRRAQTLEGQISGIGSQPYPKRIERFYYFLSKTSPWRRAAARGRRGKAPPRGPRDGAGTGCMGDRGRQGHGPTRGAVEMGGKGCAWEETEVNDLC